MYSNLEQYIDIIKPIWIYLITIIDGLKTIITTCTGLSTVLIVIAFIKGYKKILKIFFIILIGSIILNLVIPDYNTLVNMLILKISKEENIAITKDIIEKIFLYIDQIRLFH